MKLHLFNPENDLALGLGCANYTPPPHAAAIHRAGALLPLWWAEKNDLILAPDSLAAEAEKLKAEFGLDGELCSGNMISQAEAAPWGWSADARRQFMKVGVDSSRLPDDRQLEKLRLLSHRRMSIAIINRLDGGYPLPLEATDPQTVIDAERKSPGCFIKSPWSGSGRGVFCARTLDENSLRQRADGIIHRQGSVMVERGLDKVLDFAALFQCHEGKAGFKGLSVFRTEARGMYSGNLVAPQDVLQSEIYRYLAPEILENVLQQLESILSELIGTDYNGWLGIDMMVYNEDGRMKLMPCVELNLRMTMGVVAMKIQEKLHLNQKHLFAWNHGDKNRELSDGSVLLLPPSDGFSLNLSSIHN